MLLQRSDNGTRCVIENDELSCVDADAAAAVVVLNNFSNLT